MRQSRQVETSQVSTCKQASGASGNVTFSSQEGCVSYDHFAIIFNVERVGAVKSSPKALAKKALAEEVWSLSQFNLVCAVCSVEAAKSLCFPSCFCISRILHWHVITHSWFLVWSGLLNLRRNSIFAAVQYVGGRSRSQSTQSSPTIYESKSLYESNLWILALVSAQLAPSNQTEIHRL